jgi:hypothetical protein
MSPKALPYTGLLEGFGAVAPGLRELRLLNRPSDPLISQLHLCARLRTLVCHPSIDLQATLDALPWPSNPGEGLHTLELEVDYNALSLLRLLSLRLFSSSPSTTHDRLPAGPLSHLQTLILHGTTSTELQTMGQAPFLEWCERGGVRVLLDVEEEVGGREMERRRVRGLFDGFE